MKYVVQDSIKSGIQYPDPVIQYPSCLFHGLLFIQDPTRAKTWGRAVAWLCLSE